MYYLALTGKVLLTPDLAEGTGNEDSKQARPATKGLAAPTLEVSGPDWLLHDVIAFFSKLKSGVVLLPFFGFLFIILSFEL